MPNEIVTIIEFWTNKKVLEATITWSCRNFQNENEIEEEVEEEKIKNKRKDKNQVRSKKQEKKKIC